MRNLSRLIPIVFAAVVVLACTPPWQRTPPAEPASATPDNSAGATAAPAPFRADVAALFNGNAAAPVAYDETTARAFVLNEAGARVDILDVSEITAPVFVASIDVTPYGQNPTSVAVRNGVAAIAVEADKKTAAGTVLLVDMNGAILGDIKVGALPSALAFTPDGARLIVANRGAANKQGTKNPEGSVSVIDLSDGPARVSKGDVRTAGFAQFNDAVLDPQIRIVASGASVAQDLEPTSVVIAPDGSTAQIAMPKNHATALVDIATATVSALSPLAGVTSGAATVLGFHDLPIADLPEVGTTAEGQHLTLGGFSALTFEGVDSSTGMLNFLTLTDRGPNAGATDIDDSGFETRPFPLPDYAPRLVRLAVDPRAGTAHFVSEMLLTDAAGKALTGLPNLDGEPGMANADEPAIDLRGKPLPFDPSGIDPEGLAVAADGSFWIVEEYRPSILHFDAAGKLIRRFVPFGANANPAGVNLGVEALPGVLMQRTSNHGFEAAVFDGTILYAFMQSPLDNPDRADDANARDARIVRMIAFDTVAEKTVGQYVYLVDGDNVDKIGDAVALGNGEFLVIERDNILGPSARKYIYRISLEGATNLEDVVKSAPVGPNQGLEALSLAEMALAGIRPVQKRLFVDLTAAGYTQGDKVEGLALVGDNRLALVNDEDFGMSGGFDPATGLLSSNPARVPSLLTLIDIDPGALGAGN